MSEAAPESTPHGIDDLLERLRKRVEERRANGDYPAELEEQLEDHFRRIVLHRQKADTAQLQADIDAIDSHMDFTQQDMGVDSNFPGGEIMHKAFSKALHRHTAQLHQQLQEFAEAVRRAMQSLANATQDPNSHTHGDLIGHLDAVLERLASYERAPVDSTAALGDLRRRVEELERAEARRDFKPWFTNDAFEEHFRGSKEQLLAQYEDLADEIWGYSPVLDFGCGRGEFLELLKSRGTECWGVEIDPVLAKDAQDNGLDVRAGDGLQILASQTDGSLGGIVLLQVIEHLSQQQQLDLVALAYDKLRPGGRIIVETVNPQSLYVYAHAFYIDPTHTRPVHPAYMAFLFEQAGFDEVKWQWRTPPPADDILESEGNADTVTNRNVERLNRLLFAPGDYALIVTKAL